MARSFCNGCKYWEYAERGFGDPGFWYCDKLAIDSLLKRKEFCGGTKLTEEKDG